MAFYRWKSCSRIVARCQLCSVCPPTWLPVPRLPHGVSSLHEAPLFCGHLDEQSAVATFTYWERQHRATSGAWQAGLALLVGPFGGHGCRKLTILDLEGVPLQASLASLLCEFFRRKLEKKHFLWASATKVRGLFRTSRRTDARMQQALGGPRG